MDARPVLAPVTPLRLAATHWQLAIQPPPSTARPRCTQPALGPQARRILAQALERPACPGFDPSTPPRTRAQEALDERWAQSLDCLRMLSFIDARGRLVTPARSRSLPAFRVSTSSLGTAR